MSKDVLTTEQRLHVHRVAGHYIGQVRLIGCQRWMTVTGRCRTAQGALSGAVRKMSNSHKRARALWVGNGICYYDPHVSMEANRV